MDSNLAETSHTACDRHETKPYQVRYFFVPFFSMFWFSGSLSPNLVSDFEHTIQKSSVESLILICQIKKSLFFSKNRHFHQNWKKCNKITKKIEISSWNLVWASFTSVACRVRSSAKSESTSTEIVPVGVESSIYIIYIGEARGTDDTKMQRLWEIYGGVIYHFKAWFRLSYPYEKRFSVGKKWVSYHEVFKNWPLKNRGANRDPPEVNRDTVFCADSRQMKPKNEYGEMVFHLPNSI